MNIDNDEMSGVLDSSEEISKKETYYVRNSDLLEEIKKYKESCQYDEDGNYIMGSGKMSNSLGRMITKIANGLSQRPNYSGYTWLEDMKGEAILTVLKYIRNFDPNKSNNPFGYITQICTHSFMSYITNQKKHSTIKNQLFENKEKFIEESLLVYSEKAINYTELADSN